MPGTGRDAYRKPRVIDIASVVVGSEIREPPPTVVGEGGVGGIGGEGGRSSSPTADPSSMCQLHVVKPRYEYGASTSSRAGEMRRDTTGHTCLSSNEREGIIGSSSAANLILERRRAQLAEELRSREAAEAEERLRRRAEEMVAACEPKDDEDEESVLKKFEALRNKLEATRDIFTARAEGNEDSYRTWASSELYKKEEEQRQLENARRKQAAEEEARRAEDRWVRYLRSIIESIVDSIDFHHKAVVVAREEERLRDLDRRLQEEASERLRLREERKLAEQRRNAEFEAQLFSSGDPMIEVIRRERAERLAEQIAREAEEEASEEAQLEAKLARLNSRLGCRK